MAGKVNSTLQPATTLGATDKDSEVDEVGPLSVLPICVSLFALIAIVVAACVFYRKRQRQRAQVLARQLRVTERRIDAVGSLREKKERNVGRRPIYYPPTDVRASASEPSIVTRPTALRPHYVLRAYQTQLVPIHRKLQAQMSVVNSSACSCDYGVDSTFCSTCKDIADEKMRKRDASTGSLAVELATVPSLGSLTTINTPSCHPALRRTRSDVGGVQMESPHPLPIGNTPERDGEMSSKHILAWMKKSSTQPAHLSSLLPPSSSTQLPSTHPEAERDTPLSVATTNEQDPPPNTPTSHSIATSVDIDGGKVLNYISEDEKWV